LGYLITALLCYGDLVFGVPDGRPEYGRRDQEYGSQDADGPRPKTRGGAAT
jgi:hypothetical protein